MSKIKRFSCYLINKIKQMPRCVLIGDIILILIGGGLIVHHYVKKAEMIAIAKAHQADMEAEVRYDDKDHHIKTITFEY